jgi:hypothetical protein|tara:strand:+ start:200 stop:427 length:228 start_codon:yes stop_codon:yes gene_type:complete
MSSPLKKGDLVHWYESYADDFAYKDVGTGIILEKINYEVKFKGKGYENFKVFRTKHNDTMIFESREIRKIEKEND